MIATPPNKQNDIITQPRTVMTKPRTLKLRAFRIENNDPNYDKSPLLDMLGEKLEKSEKAEERRIQLNDDDPTLESDLIADFDIKRKDLFIFGSMMRIVAAKGTPSLPDKVFQQKRIPYDSLNKLTLAEKFIYRSLFYFATDGFHLIVTLPSNRTISSFQTYINDYLKSERRDHLFEFSPVITDSPQARAENIKSIRFKDSTVKMTDASSSSEIKTKMMRVKEDLLRFMFQDSPELTKILDEGIVSAELLIKFASPKDKSKDSQAFLGPILKPMSDLDNFEIKTKTGETIKGSTIQRSKDIILETNELGMISEPQLYQEMEAFLKELM